MSYLVHPHSLPHDPAAELAAAEEAARQEARERIAAAVRARAGEGVGAGASAAAAADGAPLNQAPGGFGRGWIPASRDIGLPGDDMFGAAFAVAAAEAGELSDVWPEVAAGADLGLTEPGRDGPLPAQGRRGVEDAPEPQPRRERVYTERSIDFTGPRRALFLHHLAEQGNVRVACSQVRISPQAAYLARRRDAVFRAGWEAALVHSREHALQVLANRALDGIREEVWHRGELVGHKVRHDSRLLLAHLGRLDARCQDEDEVVQARAARFDELLALVAGEDYDLDLRDQAEGVTRPEWDEILPITRARHADRAAALAESKLRWGTGYECDDDDDDEPEAEEPGPVESAQIAARAAAEAAWDDWGDRVAAVNAALEAGEEPVVASLPAWAAAAPGAGAEPPYEVKSLPAAAIGRRRPGRPADAALLGGASFHGLGGAVGMGAEFFARTPFGSSTCSAGAPPRGA